MDNIPDLVFVFFIYDLDALVFVFFRHKECLGIDGLR